MVYQVLNIPFLENYLGKNATPQNITDLLTLFITSADADWKSLVVAVNLSNYPGIEAASHRLKSAYRYLNMTEIADIFATISRYAQQKGDIKQIHKELENLHTYLETVKTEINHYLTHSPNKHT